jgi:hypothetical protein
MTSYALHHKLATDLAQKIPIADLHEGDGLVDWRATHWAAPFRNDPDSVTPLQARGTATTRDVRYVSS